MADFALLESSNMISCKIWVIKRSWNFHTVWYEIFFKKKNKKTRALQKKSLPYDLITCTIIQLNQIRNSFTINPFANFPNLNPSPGNIFNLTEKFTRGSNFFFTLFSIQGFHDCQKNVYWYSFNFLSYFTFPTDDDTI